MMDFEIFPQRRHFTSLLSLNWKDFRKEVSQFDGIIFFSQYCEQVVSNARVKSKKNSAAHCCIPGSKLSLIFGNCAISKAGRKTPLEF